MSEKERRYEVVIIGSGPAGLTAAIYVMDSFSKVRTSLLWEAVTRLRLRRRAGLVLPAGNYGGRDRMHGGD